MIEQWNGPIHRKTTQNDCDSSHCRQTHVDKAFYILRYYTDKETNTRQLRHHDQPKNSNKL